MAVTIQDVQQYSKTGWSNLPDDNKTKLLETAENMVDNQFSGKTSTVSELEGNRDNAIELLTAHLWELAEGGEAASESGSGGSVSYNTVTGEWKSSLSETRYGRMFRDSFLGDEMSTGIVRTH